MSANLKGITFHYDIGDNLISGKNLEIWYSNFSKVLNLATQMGQNPFETQPVMGDFYPTSASGKFTIKLDPEHHFDPKTGKFWFKNYKGVIKFLDSEEVVLHQPKNSKITWKERFDILKSYNKIQKYGKSNKNRS